MFSLRVFALHGLSTTGLLAVGNTSKVRSPLPSVHEPTGEAVKVPVISAPGVTATEACAPES